MNTLYEMLGITKQAHHKARRRQKKRAVEGEYLLLEANKIRQERGHTRLGARKIYERLQPEGIGRDAFESLLFANGLKLKRKRNHTKTTIQGKKKYPNLISETWVRNPHQVYVSDLTYLPVGNKRSHYLFLIMDVYTRQVVGWKLGATMESSHLVDAIKMMQNQVGRKQLNHAILHSDRGSQYGAKNVQETLQDLKMKSSMGNKAWENGHAESLNGILKCEYLNHQLSGDLSQMNRTTRKAIELYNTDRPHGSLSMKTPLQFKEDVAILPKRKRPRMKINY